MKKLCELQGIDHNSTSSYHPQANAQAETYNKTMIRYLSCMDNQSTIDWEEVLPAMMMSYNCHVHRATGESPFFLTHLHNPRLPIFNLNRPNPLYLREFARENLFLTEDARKAYFNKSVEKRNFCVGDKVLVKFSMFPKGVNPKFFKKWRGGFVVVKKVGYLNLLVCASPHSKPILVHVDAHPNNQLVKFDPEKGKAVQAAQGSTCGGAFKPAGTTLLSRSRLRRLHRICFRVRRRECDWGTS